MKIKSLVVTTILLTSTIWSQAQQINPVPDYVFRNQMSVGRNAVTDTAAYFSIGPRYGATKGFMPPIVGDTATFSSGKRNGLLIFSVQKNKFLYWDSVRVQWSDMAGSSGAYIVAGDTASMLAPYLRKVDTTAMLSPYYRSATASAALALKLNISDTSSMLANYIRHAGYGLTKSGQSFLVDTLNIATRAWRQKGLDSLAALEVSGSGTTNYVAKFTAGSTIGNSQIFDNGTSVGIGTTTPSSTSVLEIGKNGDAIISAKTSSSTGNSYFRAQSTTTNVYSAGIAQSTGTSAPFVNDGAFQYTNGAGGMQIITGTATPIQYFTNNTERLRIFANGRVFVGSSPTDAGYQLDVAGSLRNTTGANFATSSGNVGVGTTTALSKFHMSGGAATFSTTNFNDASTGGAVKVFSDDNNGGKIWAQKDGNQAWGYLSLQPLGGDVGIATTSPAYKLDINGTLRSVNGANFATTSGRVGVGTASPQYLVEAYQNGLADVIVNSAADNNSAILSVFNSGGTSGNFAQLRAYGNTTGGTLFGSSTNKMISLFSNGDALMTIGTISATSLAFGTANAERARFSGAGELLINTTSDAGDYKLQVAGNIYNTGSAVLAATSGNVGIGTASPSAKLTVVGAGAQTILNSGSAADARMEFHYNSGREGFISWDTDNIRLQADAGNYLTFFTNATERGRINSAGEWIIDASGTDAGDYKLQVVGNARVGTGKLDIASNTTFGLGIARSGTSEVAGQIYNSNGILYLGAESSAGGQIFSGSSAYAAVIGSGAAYPLQFATDNVTRATINTNGELLINTTTDAGDYKLQVSGNGYLKNGQVLLDSVANKSALFVSQHSVTGSASSNMIGSTATWNTTGNPALIDFSLTNTASGSDANYIKISDGTNTFRVTKAAEVVTAAPSGGSIKPWKLGEAATVSPTSPNRTIRVEIDGTVYYLHAKTTND